MQDRWRLCCTVWCCLLKTVSFIILKMFLQSDSTVPRRRLSPGHLALCSQGTMIQEGVLPIIQLVRQSRAVIEAATSALKTCRRHSCFLRSGICAAVEDKWHWDDREQEGGQMKCFAWQHKNKACAVPLCREPSLVCVLVDESAPIQLAQCWMFQGCLTLWLWWG